MIADFSQWILCRICGRTYGEHAADCPAAPDPDDQNYADAEARLWEQATGEHPPLTRKDVQR